MEFSKINKNHLAIVIVYWIGFSIGTISHTVDIATMVFLGYSFAPLPFNIFWTLLVVFDPLVILFFFLRFQYAISLAVIIMIFDISINLVYGFITKNNPILFGLITQIPFGCFVFMTANYLFPYQSMKDFLYPKCN
ncbi:hypothetical protein EHQ16_13110 [Leptospira kanakyensis]|uniref:Uncharacterized protein n=1 Tax=Leptospira kanakyensis TaxID=2484968 RepID=A0A6N4QD31_9LEPT|nr:hypothetical protein [Leptospira kanakyensis]TGK49959.1 hypothetical protein EHQ11_09510 [Leptospira kanakyensis]TGK58524.1 hypothetical protein EHQ16_13110 [Leptospira kanakyensis]TGK69097.1 hypothetical protein EHQ18_09670 [Leptospira kanakyensis]